MANTEHEHDMSRDGSSDATPGGLSDQRRPGEALFAAFLLVTSLFLLWSAYGISGFEALSAPGSVPMATTLVMVVSAAIVLVRTVGLPKIVDETVMQDILPPLVIVMALMLLAYGLLLRPLGFLPTSALFLVLSIKLLARRGWVFTLTVALGSLLVIYLVFRIVFTVLMPAGIIPEAEMIQVFRDLFSGGTK